jgi:GT2 family glycosyltransferase
MEQKSDVGLMGPRTFGRDGNIQLTCGRLPTIWNTFCQFLALDRVANRWPLFAGFQLGINEHERSREVEVLSGCFWLARRRAISEVGLLDERFFFYAEDVDWCKRFRDARWKLWFVAEAQATHYGGGSSGNATLRFTIEILRANLLYWKKHHGQKGRAAYWALAMAQHCLRLIARGAVELSSSHANEKTKQKLEEHKVCVRWLLTGKGV